MKYRVEGVLGILLLMGVGYASYVSYWQAPDEYESVVIDAKSEARQRSEAAELQRSSASDFAALAGVSSSSSSIARGGTLDELISLALDFAAENPDWAARAEAYERSRGHFYDTDYAAYEPYEATTLETMLEGGDMLAGQVLAQRAEDEGRDDVARHYWHAAAVLGSQRALEAISSTHFRSYQKAFYREDTDIAHREKLDYFIMQDILARRGGHTPLPKDIMQQIDLILTPQEQALVDERAQNYYQLLLNQRAARGLGEFEPPQDYTPPHLKGWELSSRSTGNSK